MKKLTVEKREITDKNVLEYVNTVVTNFGVFIEDNFMKYIAIDKDRGVYLFSEIPHYTGSDWDISDASYYLVGYLPTIYDFDPVESIWELELKFEEVEE